MDPPIPALAIASLVLLASCGPKTDDPPRPIGRVSPDPTASDERESPSAEVWIEARPVELPARALPRGAHGVRIALVNNSDESVSLMPCLEVYFYVGDSFGSFEGLDPLRLHADCTAVEAARRSTAVPECITVPAHTRLVVPPWLGVRSGVGQCTPCDPSRPFAGRPGAYPGCDLAPAGEYALRAAYCEGGEILSPRFVLPAPGRAGPR